VLLNERLLQICLRRQVPYCSMLERTGAAARQYVLADGIHANARAQALAAEEEARLLRPLLQ
jgi:hypothetical protein